MIREDSLRTDRHAINRREFPSSQACSRKRRRHLQLSTTQHDALKTAGYFPMCLQAGGDPRVAPPRFVAIFKKH